MKLQDVAGPEQTGHYLRFLRNKNMTVAGGKKHEMNSIRYLMDMI